MVVHDKYSMLVVLQIVAEVTEHRHLVGLFSDLHVCCLALGGHSPYHRDVPAPILLQVAVQRYIPRPPHLHPLLPQAARALVHVEDVPILNQPLQKLDNEGLLLFSLFIPLAPQVKMILGLQEMDAIISIDI